MNQWLPEREITIGEAISVIRSQFPDLEFTEARLFASGWDNTVVQLDENWIFRFPRREIALPGIEREISLLPWIDENIGFTVPVPTHVGEHHGWPFWGGPHISGVELAHCPAIDRLPIASTIGRFLRELHALKPPTSLPIDPFGRADSVSRAPKARDVLTDLSQLGLWHGDPGIESILDRGSRLGPPHMSLVLSHGDLYARHVLINEGAVSGIIDWGDVCAAPAAVDLAIGYSAFAGESREAFFDAYGPVDDETVLRAQSFAVFSAASVAHYAHDVGNHVLLGEALSGLAGIPNDTEWR